MKTVTKTITIPKFEAKNHQDFLDKNIKQYEETDECERTEDNIASYSVDFLDEGHPMGVDIKVCGGQPPFIDAVLFEIVKDGDQNAWHELYPLDAVGDDLLGEYIFEQDGVTFVVNVVSS